jgi:hypothetical protein
MTRALLDLGDLGRVVARLEADGVRVYDATGRPVPAAVELAALAVLARRALTGGSEPSEELAEWAGIH